jgi:hypothetical protein
MVEEIKCYRDSSGKVHQSACDAHRAELVLWLMQGNEMNEASAIKLADRMADESRALKTMIEAVCVHCPRDEAFGYGEVHDADGLLVTA